MFKYYSSYALLLTGFTHLLCCGIPFFISISSLFTNLVLIESKILNFEFLELAENYLFILTSLLFLILICIEIYNKKKRSADENSITEIQINPTEKKIRFNLILSSILYCINSVIFFSEKII